MWIFPVRLATIPTVLLALALTGCPDLTENAGGSGGTGGSSAPAGPVGKVKLVQMALKSEDPYIDGMWDFVLGPTGDKVYATALSGHVLTFDRSPLDGSLHREYDTQFFSPSGIAVTPDGKHLYAHGGDEPNQLVSFDVDAVTGEPVMQSSLSAQGRELAITGDGAWLFESSGGNTGTGIHSYRINPTSGALTAGPVTPHPSPCANYAFFVDDDAGSLYAEAAPPASDCNNAPPAHQIIRYAIDYEKGTLAKQAEITADLWWSYVALARCPGTTRLYVPQEEGKILYADISGTGLAIESSFAHPDLVHARGVALSPDCKNLYATTGQDEKGDATLVVFARDDAGDLSWLQTVHMGPGGAVFDVGDPAYARVSADGKNVYVISLSGIGGFAVFARDTTGKGFP